MTAERRIECGPAIDAKAFKEWQREKLLAQSPDPVGPPPHEWDSPESEDVPPIDVERLARALKIALPSAFRGEYPEDERAEVEAIAAAYAEARDE